MKILLFAIVFIGFVACESDQDEPAKQVETKTVDFDAFTLDIPVAWTQSTLQGFDSFVGEIETDAEEKIEFDLGMYSNQLNVDAATHNISFSVIDNKGAKLVRPKTTGQGTTGVYFESIDDTGRVRFQMSANGLSADSEKLLIMAFKSLRFK